MDEIFIGTCTICGSRIDQFCSGDPYLIFKVKPICQDCYIGLIKPIYEMSGSGDGGIIHLIFQACLLSTHNRSQRKKISCYKSILNSLLHKYKFQCVRCHSTENLTIDHINPVSNGGSDDISNLQILCKSCNSKKGAKIDV